jgi:hypothetical protein
MKTTARRTFFYMVLTLISGILLCACAGSGKQVAKTQCPGDIEWQVCKVAEIASFKCELGSFKKKPSLIYTVAVKNTDSKPHRYRVNIFLVDQDKAAGYLVPRKGKPPVVKPGETATVKIPFIKTTQLSKKMLVTVKTIGE